MHIAGPSFLRLQNDIDASQKLRCLIYKFSRNLRAKAFPLAIRTNPTGPCVGIVESPCKKLHQAFAMGNVFLHLRKLCSAETGYAVRAFDIRLPVSRAAEIKHLLIEGD